MWVTFTARKGLCNHCTNRDSTSEHVILTILGHPENIIEKLVWEMITAGMVRTSTCPFSTPIPLAKKKDGGRHFCIDYQSLNKATIPDKFLITMIEELLDKLHRVTFFTKLDLNSVTRFVSYVPFRLTNALGTFQALMNEMFKDQLRHSVQVFSDDILVYSRDIEEYKGHLRRVLEMLERNQLYFKRKNVYFGTVRWNIWEM